MIIRPAANHLHFITQSDHARLSREVMEACPALLANPRRSEVLHAIGEHDNGWAEPDAAPIVDPATGTPLDFVSAPPSVRQGVWPRGVQRLAGSPWAAALVAQHAIAVYERYRADASWSAFFTEMAERRDEMVRASHERAEDLGGDYRFVRLGDLISLAFCTGWADELRFCEWTVHGTDEGVRIDPDPFDGAVIPLAIEARELPRQRYASDSELRAHLAQARAVVLQGTVRGRDRLRS